jgi:tetratricopeptide (TPR) repeat protein
MSTLSDLAESSRAPLDPGKAEALALVESLAEDMAERWRKGEQPLVEEYLARHPELWELPEAALQLVSEEIYLRQERRQETFAADLIRRFPRWQRHVQALLNCHSLLAGQLAAPQFPQAGENLGEFCLRAELGRGAQARVFLATQPALADRSVVLKLASCSGGEHLSLARLQHTHIVPLYSVHDFPHRRLRALCLPYFGGATLARVLEILDGRPLRQRTGCDIVRALQQAPASGVVGGPACQFLGHASYTEAVCWIGACLADALQYAHERGLLHLDVKPSNVLLAADGQPMLLDFHLARAVLAAGDPAPLWLGGTPGYMAPEHRAALTAVRECRPIPAALDGRADIYALGLLLYELLSAALPEGTQTPAQTLCRRNPLVTAGLADLVAKCLTPEPEQRYRSAAALAVDLRRHLADLPLREVANRSLTERWRKWRRRHPYGLALLGLLLAVFVGGGLVLDQVGQQAEKAQAALQDGQEQLQQGRYAQARDILKYGVALAEDLPFHADLTQRLRARMQQAERGQAADELHVFSERIRPLYAADFLPSAEAQAVAAHCRSLWDKRDLIVQHLASQPASPREEQVRIDLLDLAIVWANLQVRSAPHDPLPKARQRALAILAQAEEFLGPSCVLYQERQLQARASGLTDLAEASERQASQLVPRTAWEHYALGRAYLLAGKLHQAAAHMERALQLEPQLLWPYFYKGCCALQLKEYPDAVTAFTVCVVLAPQSGWCRYNRGLAHLELGRLAQALQDFDRALVLDPTLSAAALSRGILHYRQRHYDQALADLQRVLDQGVAEPAVYYHQALVYLARQDRTAALASLQHALQHDPQHKPSRELLTQLRNKN